MSQFAQYLSTFKIFTKSCKSVHKFVFNALLPPCRRVQSFLMKLILVEVVVMYIECGIIFHYFEITSGGRDQKWGVQGGEKETDISLLDSIHKLSRC